MRAADADQPQNTSVVYYSNEASACLAVQTQVSNGAAFCAGTFVWTLSDYGGEPDTWPHVSSSFGSIDFAGFPKPASEWFRAFWLAATPASDPSRPPVALAAAVSVSIVEAWAPSANGTRTIHVYSAAPLARLILPSGAPFSAPTPPAGSGFGAAFVFYGVPFAPGALVAEALAADGATVLATHARASWGAPARLVLSLDAPSPATGTGAALLLDGADVALVRATIVDATGYTVADATLNVTFAVAAGPGLVVGCGNGDPANLDPNDAPWKPAYHGLARAIVRATLDAATPDATRALRAAIDVDAGRGPRASAIMPVGATPPTRITVTAAVAGLPAATIDIPLSTDARDSPFGAAAASVALADVTNA
jgi:hypothetical protein